MASPSSQPADVNNSTKLDYRPAIDFLIEASRTRPIVPFLGAGISISAGFPSVKSIVQYLAKVDFAIDRGTYKYRYPDHKAYGLKSVADVYREHPSKFLRDFGWPNMGQLDADLWEWLERPLQPGNGEFSLQGVGRKYLINEDQKIKARMKRDDGKPQLLDCLSLDICWNRNSDDKPKPCLDLRDHLRAIGQWSLRRDLVLRESGTSKAPLREWKRWKEWYLDGKHDDRDKPEMLYGDWESLLDRLCEGDFDLVDSLFAAFEEGRFPTTAHRYLTFLSATMDMPLMLTTNFDSLLERAYREMGLEPKIFDIHRDADLPDAELVMRRFSILKLHGSAYGLRLGERLRNPLEAETRKDVIRYLPEDSLVVVLGFSGSERRIMQLLQAIASDSQTANKPRLLWLKGPGSQSIQLQQLRHECKDYIKVCEINDASAFLQDWYFAFAGGYHSSNAGYSALTGRPIVPEVREPSAAKPRENAEIEPNSKATTSPQLSAQSSATSTQLKVETPAKMQARQKAQQEAEQAARKEVRASARLPVHVFKTTEAIEESSSAATLEAAAFVASLGYEYNTIWIDLENHHTVSGVVAEFFEQIRIYDPDAPQFTMIDDLGNTKTSTPALQKAVERIREVLARGRYIVVFDSLESFGRTQMMHHGIPSYNLLSSQSAPSSKVGKGKANQVNADKWDKMHSNLLGHFQSRLDALNDFLRELLLFEPSNPDAHRILSEFRDSYIIVTIDKPSPRQTHSKSKPNPSQTKSQTKPESQTEPKEEQTIGLVKEHLELFRTAPDKVKHINLRNVSSDSKISGKLTAHWSPSVETQNSPAALRERSLKRIVSILALKGMVHNAAADASFADPEGPQKPCVNMLRELIKPKNSVGSGPPKNLNEDCILNEQLLEPLLAVMSVFRRPRSLPMIRSIVERWLLPSSRQTPTQSIRNAHSFIDLCLDTLGCDLTKSSPELLSNAILLHEGGRVRLRRHLHHSIFNSLTENVHIGTSILNWRTLFESNVDSRAVAIIDALVIASLHFAAARTCFVDVFLPTRDVQAFYEYLYHRVAVLRILSLTKALLSLPIVGSQTADDIGAAVVNYISEILTQSGEIILDGAKDPRDLNADEPLLDKFLAMIGLTSVVPTKRTNKPGGKLHSVLEQYVQDLRTHAIQTVYLAVKRHEGFLRFAATPDTVLGWAQQFLSREILDVKGTSYELIPHVRPGVITKALDVQPKTKETLDELVEQFEHMQQRAQSAKLDFLSAIHTTLNAIASLEGKSNVQLATKDSQYLEQIVSADKESRAFLKSVNGKLKTLTAKHSKNSPPNDSSLNDEMFRAFRHIIDLGRSWLELGWTSRCRELLEIVKEKLIAYADPRARRLLRDAAEVHTKCLLNDVFHSWQALDHRWQFGHVANRDNSPGSDGDRGDEPSTGCSSERTKKRIKALEAAGEKAIEYETLLRETSETVDDDARHRSSSYVLRARVAFLCGKFREAHHYLDLAPAGLRTGRHDHAIARAMIHMTQAELLICSANHHCDSANRIQIPAKARGNKELSKVRRAAVELEMAGVALREAPHQTFCKIQLNVGWAQVCFERLVFELEKVFQETPHLDASGFSQQMGAMEQIVLKGMRHLRSGLDLVPFLDNRWEDISKCREMDENPIIAIERKIYALWIQYFVGSSFYWSVLKILHRGPRGNGDVPKISVGFVDEVITQVNGGDYSLTEMTWTMWCRSLRFEQLAKVPVRDWLRKVIDGMRTQENDAQASDAPANDMQEKDAKGKNAQGKDESDRDPTNGTPLRDAILQITDKMCCRPKIDEMWNGRRKPSQTGKGASKSRSPEDVALTST